jgi:hypothetical protein
MVCFHFYLLDKLGLAAQCQKNGVPLNLYIYVCVFEEHISRVAPSSCSTDCY